MDTEQKTQSPQPQPQSQPQAQESTTANRPQIHTTPAKPKNIFLKTVALTIILYIVISLLIFLRDKISGQSNNALSAMSNLFYYLLMLIVTPFLSYSIVTSYERKKHPEQYPEQLQPLQSQSAETDNKQTSTNSIKHAGTFVFTLLAYVFIIFVVAAGGSLLWAGSACEAEGGNDCGAGWAWGFIMLPFSALLALCLAPVLAATTTRAIEKKKGQKK